MGERLAGVCKWWNDLCGYGFLTADDGQDYFVHQTSILMEGYRCLIPNARVKFFVGSSGPKNRIQALDVVSDEA